MEVEGDGGGCVENEEERSESELKAGWSVAGLESFFGLERVGWSFWGRNFVTPISRAQDVGSLHDRCMSLRQDPSLDQDFRRGVSCRMRENAT